eukprot:m.160506 g.160506  ORF g.160506 m.160506 type:complete len:97 (-) comp18027_c1_seq11:596-886(-)
MTDPVEHARSCEWCQSICQLTFLVQSVAEHTLQVCNGCYSRYAHSRRHQFLGHHKSIRCVSCNKPPTTRKVWIDGWRKIRTTPEAVVQDASEIQWL